MSRRDTIIIALLVNACLLALLFILAINTDDNSIVDHPEINKAIVDNRSLALASRAEAPIVIADTSVDDEVDNFLKELAEDTSQPLLVDEDGYIELKPAAPTTIAIKPPVKTDNQLSDNESYVDITVKRGDALEKIARSNGTTVDAIKKANQLTSAKLTIGQVLRVPLSNKVKIPPAQTTQIASIHSPKEIEKKDLAIVDTQYYTIKSGDNPWKIAKQFNVKFEDLLKLNHLDEERARNLKIGDKVRVK
jgi:peptidoglycan DL-endopeptidase LytF